MFYWKSVLHVNISWKQTFLLIINILIVEESDDMFDLENFFKDEDEKMVIYI